ncbi:MAG: class I SAM-dependent methyltransferase [Treponema sp.]|jgi:SAM-dependent methyltransferase|nr:class I SAM-dependent methyltransferase [Treponema sp.]
MKYKAEWFNDEYFWECYAPVMFDDKRWAEVSAAADGVTRLARLNLYGADSGGAEKGARPAEREGVKVLDLCCGFGRITAELARRGFTAAGVDLTESYLRTAREDAAHENLDIEYINADARSFRRPGAFDLAVNLYISFGYFEDPKDDRLMLRNVFESLKPGGTLIMETLGKEIAVRDFTRNEWFRRAGFLVLTEYEPVDSWGGLKNRWILIDSEGKRIEKTFTQRLYGATELRSLLRETGFSQVELYGNWDEAPYDEGAETLIAAARKQGGTPR